MTNYHNFVGIDVGKDTFVAAFFNNKANHEYENNTTGIEKFIEEYQHLLSESLIVVEATGGYELNLVYTLIAEGHRVHRAHSRKVKHFIRSFGSLAKNDALDAKALACYGKERAQALELFQAQSKAEMELFQLVQRRTDLKQMLIAEKNRLKSPLTEPISAFIEQTIKLFQQQIEDIALRIRELIAQDQLLKARQAKLITIPGIGEIVSFELLILLPELGTLDRRKIASLAGLAPIARDSGQFSGYRKIAHGRQGVKPALFIVAMAANNSKTYLREFYERLVAKGKKKMVALTALMRKILVIANARLKASS